MTTARTLAMFLITLAILPASVAAEKRTPSERAVRQIQALGIDEIRYAFARAAATQQRAVLDLLLEARTDPNQPDEQRRTPLFHAAAARDWKLAARLLAAGAAPGFADELGVTPLMLACAYGHADTVRAFIDAGAAVDATDRSGRTALHYALAAKKSDTALALLASRAAVDLRDSDGRDALAFAVGTRDWRVIQPILERLSGREWDFFGRSALEQAIAIRDVARVRLVLSRHNGPPCPEGCADPLLAYAAAANELNMARLLLDAGADPNTTFGKPAESRFLEYIPAKFLRHYLSEEPGMTVLMVAAGMGHEQMVRLLLEHGAERGRATRSKYKLVPLYFAAWGEHADCIQALIADAPTPDQFRIDIDLRVQKATFYRDGAPALSTEISSGRAGFSTPTGRFVITDKKSSHMSTIYKVKMPFFMRLSCRDFGLHEGVVPDYPASHGCIRLPGDAAKRLFREAPVGTLVTITN